MFISSFKNRICKIADNKVYVSISIWIQIAMSNNRCKKKNKKLNCIQC